MRVIGVVDLLDGRAVHARAGRRESYAPVQTVARSSSTPATRSRSRATTSTNSASPSCTSRTSTPSWAVLPQDTIVTPLAALGAPLWLDAGVSSADRARHALDLGASHVVVGLETLASYDALGRDLRRRSAARASPSASICATASRSSLRARLVVGRNCRRAGRRCTPRAPRTPASARSSCSTWRVSAPARGSTFALIARVRDAAPGLMLLAGGGVRGLDDLARLADAGCDGALVATALHDGRLGAPRSRPRCDISAASTR